MGRVIGENTSKNKASDGDRELFSGQTPTDALQQSIYQQEKFTEAYHDTMRDLKARVAELEGVAGKRPRVAPPVTASMCGRKKTPLSDLVEKNQREFNSFVETHLDTERDLKARISDLEGIQGKGPGAV